MAKPIGKSPSNPIFGGETWTIVWHLPPPRVTGLEVSWRVRIEKKPGSGNNLIMYPEENTKLYVQGNDEIEMTLENASNGTYSFSVVVDGVNHDLWWSEKFSPSYGEQDEAQIGPTDPNNGGTQPWGSAGGRR